MSDQASEMDIEDQLLNDLPPRDSTISIFNFNILILKNNTETKLLKKLG